MKLQHVSELNYLNQDCNFDYAWANFDWFGWIGLSGSFQFTGNNHVPLRR